MAALAAILAAELLLISARVEHLAFQDAPGLRGVIFDLGPWKARLLVTLAAVSLLFWQARGRKSLDPAALAWLDRGIAWRWLIAHFSAILLFAWLTFSLFGNALPELWADAMVLAWIAAGVVSVLLAGLAFVPAAVWKQVLRGTGDVWAYVAALAAGGCLLAALASRLWQPLAHWTLTLSSAMLHPFVPGLGIDPSAMVFGTPAFQVEVAPACSGYEGIGLILAFTTAWLWFFRREWRFPHALLLIPAGVAAMWIFNAVRVAALVLIGIAGAPGIAMQGFHSHAGWIAFNVVALGTCLAARRVSWLTTRAPAGTAAIAGSSEGNPTAAYLMPFLAILAAALLAGAASSGFEWLYPLRVLAAAAALWYFRSGYRSLAWRVEWPALALGVLVFLIWIGLEPLLGPGARLAEPAGLAQSSALPRIAWLAIRVLGAVVTVPLAEELAFRGFLLRRLAAADFESVSWRAFSWAPFLISSIAFGILHGQRWLAGTIAGMIYALALLRRGRIGEAAAAHATTNALLAVWVLATGNWQLW